MLFQFLARKSNVLSRPVQIVSIVAAKKKEEKKNT